MASTWRSELGSYAIITTAAVLIWLWAAVETREQKTITITMELVSPAGSDSWIIEPKIHAFNIDVEGSRLALQRVETLARDGIKFTVAAQVGEQIIDIEQALLDDPDFRSTGAELLSIDRPQATPSIDRLISIELPVTPSLPGLQTVGELQPRVEPSTVTVKLPSRLQNQFPNIRVQAFLDQSRSSQLSADIPYQLDDIQPRLLPEELSNRDHVSVTPPTVKLSFTIRSQIRELLLDRPVNVQIAGPPEDQFDFLVELETNSIRDVTVIADADLIRQIEAGEATVIAFVHLMSLDKEQIANDSVDVVRPVSYFMAIINDIGHSVNVRVNDSDETPKITLRVSRRPTQPAGE